MPKEKKQMSQAEQNYQIKQRKLRNEIQNIQRMSLQQLRERNNIKNESLQMPFDETKLFAARQINNQLDDKQRYKYDLETPGQKHYDLLKEINKMRQIHRIDNKFSTNWSLFKRRKLGIDTFLITFAIFGSFLLPLLFYNKFKIHKQIIVNNRRIKPEQIKNIDQNSKITIDQVSQQSIHYQNFERQQIVLQYMQKVKRIEKLQYDLDL